MRHDLRMRHIRLWVDGAPGEWVPDCSYFRALASAIAETAGGWVETGWMDSTPLSPYLDALVTRPADLGPAVPGVTVTLEWYVHGIGLVRASFEGRKQHRRGFPPYWVRGHADLLHPAPRASRSPSADGSTPTTGRNEPRRSGGARSGRF